MATLERAAAAFLHRSRSLRTCAQQQQTQLPPQQPQLPREGLLAKRQWWFGQESKPSRLYRRFTTTTTTDPSQSPPLQVQAAAAVAPDPLVLLIIGDWIDHDSDGDEDENRKEYPLVLMPNLLTTNNTVPVETVDDIVDAVNQHYSACSQFVGGMGEQDPGVWFAPIASSVHKDDDVLGAATLPLLRDAMQACREERHGVPFSVYTSGVQIADAVTVASLRFHSVQVSLWAASPVDYGHCTGRPHAVFSEVCGFVAHASECGVPVEVGVLRPYAEPARALALSLGARHVHVYDDP